MSYGFAGRTFFGAQILPLQLLYTLLWFILIPGQNIVILVFLMIFRFVHKQINIQYLLPERLLIFSFLIIWYCLLLFRFEFTRLLKCTHAHKYKIKSKHTQRQIQSYAPNDKWSFSISNKYILDTKRIWNKRHQWCDKYAAILKLKIITGFLVRHSMFESELKLCFSKQVKILFLIGQCLKDGNRYCGKTAGYSAKVQRNRRWWRSQEMREGKIR